MSLGWKVARREAAAAAWAKQSPASELVGRAHDGAYYEPMWVTRRA
jgi:hypothetical protein